MLIQVKSAGFEGGNMAEISINNVPVEIKKNENNDYRGLHVVLINHDDGKVILAQAYDTYQTSEKLDELISEIVQEGQIVVAACKDDCTFSLSFEAK